jgi:hypothetical protein
MLEYMASQYTGGVYPAIAAIVDNLLPAPTTEKPDRTLAEMPLFRSALVQEDAGGEVNRLYDKIEKFTRYVSTMKKLQAESPEDARRYVADNQENIAKGAAAEKIKAALNKVSEAENNIRISPMTGEQKKLALDNFKKVKTNLARQYSTFFQ